MTRACDYFRTDDWTGVNDRHNQQKDPHGLEGFAATRSFSSGMGILSNDEGVLRAKGKLGKGSLEGGDVREMMSGLSTLRNLLVNANNICQ